MRGTKSNTLPIVIKKYLHKICSNYLRPFASFYLLQQEPTEEELKGQLW